MYWDMASSYEGFGHGIELGDFDPYIFIDAIIGDPGYSNSVDLALIQQGSAVKILLMLSDWLDECDSLPMGLFSEHLHLLISSNKLAHIPETKRLIEAGLTGNPNFHNDLTDIYKNYVRRKMHSVFK